MFKEYWADNVDREIAKYKRYKFPSESLAYLTEKACNRAKSIGRDISRGPYKIIAQYPYSENEASYYLKGRNVMLPDWISYGHTELDYGLHEWLTETEYYIQINLRPKENADDNWHPEIGDSVRIFKGAHPSLVHRYHRRKKMFFRCNVIALDYGRSYDPRELPRLVVEHRFITKNDEGFDAIEPPTRLENIDPMLCW